MYNIASTTLSVQQLIPYLRLARTENIGASSYQKLLIRYKTPEAVLDILPSLPQIKNSKKSFKIPTTESILEEIEKTFQYSGQFLLLGFNDYPSLLNSINNPPPVLITLGNHNLLHQRNVAIVGGRNASLHGIKIAESLAADLSSHNIGITSGLARGIDGAAHKGALYTGFTIGVIACGINIAYPFEHQKLQQSIAEKGVVISEFPIGSQPQSTHFPRRNRLIAGISWGCVVIEAAQHSGSLITSKLALEYNRPVFAVPGSPLDPRCKGSNNLLRHGATFTENASDIIAELPTSLSEDLFSLQPHDLFSKSTTKNYQINIENNIKTAEILPKAIAKPALSIEQSILSLLSTTPTSIDLILRNVSHPATEILSTLTLLEINKKVTFSNSGYILTPPSS